MPRKRLPLKALRKRRSSRRAARGETLEKIDRAARSLFIEHGFSGTRPQDITRRAGVGHGTFYIHYPDKVACFMAFAESAIRELDLHVQAKLRSGSLQDRITSTASAVVEYSRTHPEIFRFAMADFSIISPMLSNGPPLLTKWSEEWTVALQRSVGHGNADTSYDPTVLGHAIAGALYQGGKEALNLDLSSDRLISTLNQLLSQSLNSAGPLSRSVAN